MSEAPGTWHLAPSFSINVGASIQIDKLVIFLASDDTAMATGSVYSIDRGFEVKGESVCDGPRKRLLGEIENRVDIPALCTVGLEEATRNNIAYAVTSLLYTGIHSSSFRVDELFVIASWSRAS